MAQHVRVNGESNAGALSKAGNQRVKALGRRFGRRARSRTHTVRAVARVAGGVERGVHHPEWDARSAYPVCCAAHASDRRPAQSDAIAGHRPRKPVARVGRQKGSWSRRVDRIGTKTQSRHRGPQGPRSSRLKRLWRPLPLETPAAPAVRLEAALISTRPNSPPVRRAHPWPRRHPG